MIGLKQELKGEFILKKIYVTIISIVLIFVLTGCGGNNEKEKPANIDSTNDNASKVTEPTDNIRDENFVPQKAVPKDLPVFPGAILWFDSETWAAEGTNWMWFYNTTGSANQIVEFFTAELKNLEFEIDAFALGEEFSVRDVNGLVNVGWIDDGIEDVNPDTPGRGYMIIVNLDAWNNR